MKIHNQIILLIILALYFSGCAGRSYYEYRSQSLGQKVGWEDDEIARVNNTESIEVHSPMLYTDSGDFVLQFKQSYRVDEYRYDAFQQQKRKVKELDLTPLAVLNCTMEMKLGKCKPKTKSWNDTGEIDKQNYTLTGRSKVMQDGKIEGVWTGEVVVDGYTIDNIKVSSGKMVVSIENSEMKFNIKQVLKTMPKHSVKAYVSFEAKNISGYPVEYTVSVGKDLLEKMYVHERVEARNTVVVIGDLMWQDAVYEVLMHEEMGVKPQSKQGANYYCENLSYKGYSDWYLPSRYELEALYKNKSKLTHGRDKTYWSSNDYGEYGKVVSFSDGDDFTLYASSINAVRCVRKY